MKIPLLIAATLCVASALQAQASGSIYSPEQLDELVGPIALYPDPLVALVLPASTDPADLALAASYLAAGSPAGGIEAQPWEASVKALAHYPDVVRWMNDNLDWTQALGAAFAQQPTDVMKSVQQLRARARAAGTLVDTPQQRIDMEGDAIRIIPSQANEIFVPEYDPAIVYETPVGYSGPFITFGIGFPVGAWLGYECNWDDFGIWYGPWNSGWGYRRDWRHPGSGANAWRAWRPDSRRTRELVRNSYRPESRLPTARIIGGYRAPVRQPAAAPRPMVSRGSVQPDYRGRPVAAPRPASPAPSSRLFGGYDRGSQTRDFSGRGQQSRSSPVHPISPRKTAPARASGPARAPAPAPPGARERH